jgi:hypothetical protein
MPCRDYMDDKQLVHVEIEKKETVEKLCEAYRVLEEYKLMRLVSLSGRQWYTAHKKEDEARLKAEKDRLDKKRKKEYILSKLSLEERKILGLI